MFLYYSFHDIYELLLGPHLSGTFILKLLYLPPVIPFNVFLVHFCTHVFDIVLVIQLPWSSILYIMPIYQIIACFQYLMLFAVL